MQNGLPHCIIMFCTRSILGVHAYKSKNYMINLLGMDLWALTSIDIPTTSIQCLCGSKTQQTAWGAAFAMRNDLEAQRPTTSVGCFWGFTTTNPTLGGASIQRLVNDFYRRCGLHTKKCLQAFRYKQCHTGMCDKCVCVCVCVCVFGMC